MFRKWSFWLAVVVAMAIPVSVLVFLKNRQDHVSAEVRKLEETVVVSKPRRFVYSAVLEGLKKDGADPELFRVFLSSRDEHFVIKCEICHSVATALSVYTLTGSKPFSSSFPRDLELRLKSQDLKVRMEGLQKLVERYIATAFEESKMTGEEKKEMRERLDEVKRFSMSWMKDWKQDTNCPFKSDSCPSCNGATQSSRP